MLITIDGPDLAGKSTLTKALIQRWNEYHRPLDLNHECLVIHKGPPTPDTDPFTEYETALDEPSLRDAILSPMTLVIFDRWHAGERIYGPLLRGESRLSDAGVLHVELALAALGAYPITCLPNLPTLLERYDQRGDKLIQRDQLGTLHHWYYDNALRYEHILYDGSSPVKPLFADLVDEMSKDVVLTNLLHAYGRGTYIGEPHPQVLLVGDERGNGGYRPRPDLIRPFTPAKPFDCSTWLLDAVLEAGLQTEIGIINAYEPNIKLGMLHHALGSPATITLGHRASERLTNLGIVHEKIYHPQFAKRFKHGDFIGYVNQLKQAVALATLQRNRRV